VKPGNTPQNRETSTGKFLAIAIAGTIAASGVLPVAEASAGHKSYKSYKHVHKQKKRNNNGDLIAAGIIGLAIGAIIANSNEGRVRRVESYDRYPAPVPPRPTTYGYDDPYYDNGYDSGYVERQPLSDYSGYNQDYSNQDRGYSGNAPRVITYKDTVSLEPWSRGWYEYCGQKYRSFNPQKGTFRGYDGQDHFCVPK